MGIEQTGNGSALVNSKGFVLMLVLAFAAFLTWAATQGNQDPFPEPSPTPSASQGVK